MTPRRAWLIGAVTVGVLDIADAFIFFGIRSGTQPIRILQAIAAGLLGPAAFKGGWATALFGLCAHFCVASLIVATCFAIVRQWPRLLARPVLFGILFGLGAYVVMNFVVIPLSAASRGALTTPVVVNGLLIHAFGVGLPAVFAAHAAFGTRAR